MVHRAAASTAATTTTATTISIHLIQNRIITTLTTTNHKRDMWRLVSTEARSRLARVASRMDVSSGCDRPRHRRVRTLRFLEPFPYLYPSF